MGAIDLIAVATHFENAGMNLERRKILEGDVGVNASLRSGHSCERLHASPGDRLGLLGGKFKAFRDRVGDW